MCTLKNISAVLCLCTTANAACADLIPNDPLYSFQSYLTQIGAPTAWGISTGNVSTVVAVLDIGVNANTPDLENRVLSPALSTTGSPPLDGTGSGSKLAHGTFVSSIIAGGVNNGVGGSGIGNFSILPIQIASSNGVNQSQWVADAIDLAAANGARVINISSTTADYSLLEAAAARHKNDALVVIAAGNDNAQITMPAVYPDLFFVAGTSNSDTRWVGTGTDAGLGSNWGSFVNIAAPAADILVANGTNTLSPYGTSSGTSFATAIVSGAAALLSDINPNLTPQQIRGILESTADDIGDPGVDMFFGAGRINLGQAALAAQAVPEPLTGGWLAGGAAILLVRKNGKRRK